MEKSHDKLTKKEATELIIAELDRQIAFCHEPVKIRRYDSLGCPYDMISYAEEHVNAQQDKLKSLLRKRYSLLKEVLAIADLPDDFLDDSI